MVTIRRNEGVGGVCSAQIVIDKLHVIALARRREKMGEIVCFSACLIVSFLAFYFLNKNHLTGAPPVKGLTQVAVIRSRAVYTEHNDLCVA